MRIAYVAAAGMLIIVLLVVNIRLHTRETGSQSLPDRDVLLQLNYLQERLRNGAAEEMQSTFPEGYIFTNVLYGLSWTEVARYAGVTAELKSRAITEAEWALIRIESDEGKRSFAPDLCPPYGIFYAGWTNLLRASIVREKKEGSVKPEELAAFENACDELVTCFRRQHTPYLPSYRNAAWPADAFAAIASLAIHDRIRPGKYSAFIREWLDETDTRRDRYTGLIPHSVDEEHGMPAEGARGSSQSLILRLLPEIDTTRSRAYYAKFKESFVKKFIGMPGITEYPAGKEGSGDIDSGPVLFGIGASGTIVAIGAARANGDFALSQGISNLVEALGFPVSTHSEKWYAFGLLPLGDAFLCWSKAAVPPSAAASDTEKDGYSPLLFHLISTMVIVALMIPPVMWARRTIRGASR